MTDSRDMPEIDPRGPIAALLLEGVIGECGSDEPFDPVGDEEDEDGPAALGQGPIANSVEGGHSVMFGGLALPRWQVSIERMGEDGKPLCGIVVDLREQAVARWLIVGHDDHSTIDACACGFRLDDGHLVIPTAYLLKGGRLAHDRITRMIAPVVDHLEEWWDERDGPMPRSLRAKPEEDPNPPAIVIDRRALDMLAALHAGATVQETDDGWTIIAKMAEDATTRLDVYAGELGDREDSLGNQLIHNLLARRSWDDLVPTPAGRALAELHGHPGIASHEGIWTKPIEPVAGPRVGISDDDIDEPHALLITKKGTLRVKREWRGWSRDDGTIELSIDGRASATLPMSSAKALVDHLAPTSVKGERFTVKLTREARLSLGGGEPGILEITGRGGDTDVALTDAIVRTLRSILREGVKRDGSGGAIEEVSISYHEKDAYYTRAKAPTA